MAKAIPYIFAPVASLIDKDLGKLVIAGALIVAGISTGNFGLVAAGIGYGSTVFQKGPKVPSSQEQRLTASIDPRAFRKEVLGQTAFPCDVRYEEWSGTNQDYCDWIVCFASHAVDGLEEVWLNDELAWSQTTGVTARYAGYFSIPNLVLEGTPANAFTFASGKWNAASHRLTGCAYARFRFKVTGNSKKATSPFSSGPTTRITAIGRGAKLYDPRRDSTVAGGSGPMRANDQSTWRFAADDGGTIGENLPLLILRRLLGWRITDPATGQKRLATGSGLPPKRIDMMSFIVAANQADELVNRSAGGTEPRYHGAGVASEGDDPKTVLDALCAGCCGRFRDTGGKLSLVIPHNDLATAAADDGLDADDVIGGFTWDPDPAPEAAPNVIRGRYVDATSASLYQLIDYPEVRLPSLDGIDRIFTLDLGFVESASQAQRIAKQVLQRKQYERRFTAPFDIRAWGWPVGKVVPLTFPPLGFERRLFRVSEQTIGTGASCQMVLDGESPDIYAWDADDRAPVIGIAGTSYDPTKVTTAIARGAYQLLGLDDDTPVTTTDTTIKLEAFRGTIDDGRIIDFPAVEITGLMNAANYRLFYALEPFDQPLLGADDQPLLGADDQPITTQVAAGGYQAVPMPALEQLANPSLVSVRRAVTAADATGTYPPTTPAPAGDGGTGYGGGGRYQTNQVLA